MNLFVSERKKRNNYENRWNLIERRHISSIKIGHRNDAAKEICKNLLKTKQFVKEHHMKVLMGEESKRLCLDPNLVMDIRHKNIKRRSSIGIKSISTSSMEPNLVHVNGYAKKSLEDREQFQQMQAMNREIDKFKKNLESQRPKSNQFDDTKHPKSSANTEQNQKNEAEEKIPWISMTNDSKSESFNWTIGASLDNLSTQYHMENVEQFSHYESLSSPKMLENIKWNNSPPFTKRTSDVQEKLSPGMRLQKEHNTPFKVSVQPKEKSKKTNDCLELIIKPTFTVNLQENRSNVCIESTDNRFTSHNRTSTTMTDHKISLDHNMSILIKKLNIDGCSNISNESTIDLSDDDMKNTTEKNIIINDLFSKQVQANYVLLQKYFLKWIHFTTIEKLTRRNPEQTRLNKMEAFLKNITLERKRTLKKLNSMNGTNDKRENVEPTKLPHFQMESPRLLARKFNNKIKIQQDIIELQKIKLQRQERIIAELKLTKLLDDAHDSKNNVKEELKFVVKNGCQNARSKARCLQIAGNLKDAEDDETYAKIQAKGLTAPKFLIEMQARALEREIRHQQAQERREHLEREKEMLRIAAEEAKHLQDKQAKRERMEELRRKRRKEKQQKAQKELERLKYVADVERAKSFYRYRTLKCVFQKFRNLVNWKKYNEHLSNAFRCQLISRHIFRQWKNLVDSVWNERKAKADACYNRHLLAVGWSLWQKYYLVEHSKKLLADDWYDLRISERVFRIWHNVTAQQRMIYEIKQKQAEAHYDWHLKWKVLDHWRRLRLILQIEKETEQRRERWRNKIHELLPDYTPHRSEFD